MRHNQCPCATRTLQGAIGHYDGALTVARRRGDTSAEAMVCMGKGYALLNTGDFRAALPPLRRCHTIAVAAGETPQATFVQSLIAQATVADACRWVGGSVGRWKNEWRGSEAGWR